MMGASKGDALMLLTSNAGHSPGSPGAFGNGHAEHDVNRMINAAIIKECSARGVTCVDSTSNASTQAAVLNEQARIANASGAELGVSIHLDAAASNSATGVTVLCAPDDPIGYAHAVRVAAALSGALGLRNRGAVVRSDLYWLNQTSMTAILIECGFITNANDIRLILSNIPKIASVVLDALGAPKAVAPAPAPKVQDAVVLFHAASDVVMNLIVEAWGKGFAGYPLPVGKTYRGALSYVDALNYIPMHGASAETMFPEPDGEWSVGAVHCTLEYANEIKANCDALGVACTIHLAGPNHVGYQNMTATLAAALVHGIDFPAVFGIPA